MAEVAAWLRKASSDMRAADHGMLAHPPILDAVVFHSQPVVEKAMKAFLSWHDVPFRKTHSLEELGEQCVQLEAGLARLVDEVVPLTEYAWRFRYPGEIEEPTIDEARTAVALAHEFVEAIRSRLPSAAGA